MKLSLSYPWRFAGIVLTCAAILVARSPDQFTTPKLIAEDGNIFFADAFNYAPIAAILTPYSGYWHLIPRLIAEAGSFLPLDVVPLFYAFCALVLSSVALSWFYLPNFRNVVVNDDLRLLFVLLLVLMPILDPPLLIAYSQWQLALWGMLLVLMKPPRKLWVQWVLAFAYIAAQATAPVLFVLFPLWLWRMFKAPSRAQRYWIAMILAGTLFMFIATLQVREPPQAVDWQFLVTDIARGVAFRYFVSPFLGLTLSNEIARVVGWPAIYVLAIIVAVVLALAVAAATKSAKNDSRRWIYLALAYIVVSTAALYLRRAPVYHYPFASSEVAPLDSLRYFFLGISGVYLLCLMVLDHFVTEQRITGSLIWIAVLIVLLLDSPNFVLWRWWDPDWSHTVHLLNHIIDPAVPDAVTWSSSYPPPSKPTASHEASAAISLRIPISPQGWTMVLNLPSGSPHGYLFPERLRLFSVDSHMTGDQLQVDLDWQIPDPQDYTAYVHLLDKQGTRINGADVKLEPPFSAPKPDDIWSTHHVFALPPGLEDGGYDVAIGLYTLQQDQVLQGSAVILRNQVHLGQPNSY